MRAFSTRSVVQTSSSPQSLKKGIWADVWGSEALSFVEIGKKEWENWPRLCTYRLIDGVLPSFIQHRASLGVVDLKPQGEANRTDVIRCVLTNKKKSTFDGLFSKILEDVCPHTYKDMKGKSIAEGLSYLGLD